MKRESLTRRVPPFGSGWQVARARPSNMPGRPMVIVVLESSSASRVRTNEERLPPSRGSAMNHSCCEPGPPERAPTGFTSTSHATHCVSLAGSSNQVRRSPGGRAISIVVVMCPASAHASARSPATALPYGSGTSR